jgi:hypothetical protein
VWADAQPPAPVLVLRATLLRARHRSEALRDLDALITRDPGDAQSCSRARRCCAYRVVMPRRR